MDPSVPAVVKGDFVVWGLCSHLPVRWRQRGARAVLTQMLRRHSEPSGVSAMPLETVPPPGPRAVR